jgi:hypothetical protein
MFLRGPGAEEDAGFYVPQDGAVYDYFGKIGEKINPGYKYFVIYKDLYTVYGGEIDWLALGRGVFTFSTELFTFINYSENKVRRVVVRIMILKSLAKSLIQ